MIHQNWPNYLNSRFNCLFSGGLVFHNRERKREREREIVCLRAPKHDRGVVGGRDRGRERERERQWERERLGEREREAVGAREVGRKRERELTLGVHKGEGEKCW